MIIVKWLLRILGATAIALGAMVAIGVMFIPRPSGHHPVAALAIVMVLFGIGPMLAGIGLFAAAAHVHIAVRPRGPKAPPRRHPWIERLEAVAGKTAAVLLIGFAAAVATSTVVYASYSALSMADSVRRARDWMPTPATVDEANIEEWRQVRRLTHAHTTVRYHYAAEGGSFASSQLLFDGNVEGNEGDVWDRPWLEGEIARLDAARRAGTQVTVFVNPANPAEAVVIPSMLWGEYATLWFLIWALGWAPVFAIMGLATRFRDRGVQRLIGNVAMLVGAAIVLIPPAGALLAAFG